MSLSKEQYKELIEEVAEDSCPHHKYCLLKRLLLSIHPDPQVLTQIKCLEKFKYEKSEELEEDIGWNEAGKCWVKEQWAKIFREEFNEDLTVREIYARVKKRISSLKIELPPDGKS